MFYNIIFYLNNYGLIFRHLRLSEIDNNVSKCFNRKPINVFLYFNSNSYFCNFYSIQLNYKVLVTMETPYSAKERRAEILQYIKNSPNLTVKELVEKFNVSEVTIRKDLNELNKRNLLIRTRGGAVRMPEVSIGNDIAIQQKQLYNYKEKKAIGKLAATLIKENETIILDSGTTTLEIAKNLQAFRSLTIITNAINIAIELSKYNRFTVILLGGHLRASSLSTVGPLAESILKIFYCDKLFLGIDSFNLEKGVSTPNIEEANINQTMMSMAKETIAVFDSSKFNKRSFAFIAPVNKIHSIVTDEGIPKDIKFQLKNMNIQVYIAKINSDY